MLFGSRDFKIMEQSTDALWQKQKIILQNIANYDTPNYKSQKVTFSQVLEDQQKSNEDKLLNVSVETDETSSIRPDGNNVDMIKENLELYKTYMQSAYLYEKISGKFSSIKHVLSTMPK